MFSSEISSTHKSLAVRRFLQFLNFTVIQHSPFFQDSLKAWTAEADPVFYQVKSLPFLHCPAYQSEDCTSCFGIATISH